MKRKLLLLLMVFLFLFLPISNVFASASIPSGAVGPKAEIFMNEYELNFGQNPNNLIDGSTLATTQYGTVLLYSTLFFNFTVTEDVKLWGIGTHYADSGGSTDSQPIQIDKFNNSTGQFESYHIGTNNHSNTWYVIAPELTKGKYRIRNSQTRGYVSFNEIYAEKINVEPLPPPPPTEEPPTEEPPMENNYEITNFETNIQGTEAVLKWINPIDATNIRVYLNGTVIYNGLNETVTIKSLEYNKSYTIRITTFDDKNVESFGYYHVLTMPEKSIEPLKAVENISVLNGNGYILLNWDKVNHPYLKGYNVYVDGNKVNTKLITTNSFRISNVTNEQSYNIQVSSVAEDTELNYFEEKFSVSKNGLPTSLGIPTVSVNFTLQDLTDGVSSWFSSLWLIVAFSIAIPLSFIIAIRVKYLFLT